MTSVAVTWRTLDDWAEHTKTFRCFDAWELAALCAWELGQSSRILHIRVQRIV